MLIQLTQKEIEAALKAYIAAKGIDMAGKTVTTVFTASRKGNGISCEMGIDDAAIPGLDVGETTVTASPLQLVKAEPIEAKVKTIAENAAEAEARAEAGGGLAPVAEEVVPEAKPAVGSLFG